MRLALEWLPDDDAAPPPQLLILLHGYGGRGALMRPLAEALRAQFPKAAILAPDAPHPVDGGGAGRQWFSARDLDDERRIARVEDALGPLQDWVQFTQQRLGVGPQPTAIGGFSQGAILALELASRADGLAGRVLAFAGRYARLPDVAPRQTTLHFFHGAADEIIPAAHARQALQHLGVLHGDATLDVAADVGHVLHPSLIDSALHRLTHHIPYRTWRAALGHTDAVDVTPRLHDAP
ncbi:esterase [Rubrivivax albus]|uniref:Esterase n=1 Tax=Rubrivivax albus TaxID=2499835 RepID=A0A437JSI3_9BURK|nr:esterase [Rubrivivax albus]RVT50022.1 esterase [Rubrivivax albus]